jgi:hypothetical protein
MAIWSNGTVCTLKILRTAQQKDTALFTCSRALQYPWRENKCARRRKKIYKNAYCVCINLGGKILKREKREERKRNRHFRYFDII